MRLSTLSGLAKTSLVAFGVLLIVFVMFFYQISWSQHNNEVMLGYVNSSRLFSVSDNPNTQARIEVDVSDGQSYKIYITNELLSKVVNEGVDRIFIKRTAVVYYQDSLKNGHLIIDGTDYKVAPSHRLAPESTNRLSLPGGK